MVLLTRVLLLGLFILAVCCAVLIAATGRHQRSFEHPRATTQRPRRAARSAAGRRRGIQSRTSLSGYQIMALSSLLAMPLAGEAAARRRKVAGKQGGRSTSPTEAGGEAARCSTTWRLSLHEPLPPEPLPWLLSHGFYQQLGAAPRLPRSHLLHTYPLHTEQNCVEAMCCAYSITIGNRYACVMNNRSRSKALRSITLLRTRTTHWAGLVTSQRTIRLGSVVLYFGRALIAD